MAPTGPEYRTVRKALAGSPRAAAVEVRRCGIGPARARAFCDQLERAPRPDGLALLGWAGGLVAGLRVGDCILADRALYIGCPEVSCAAMDLPGLDRLQRGPVLTSGRVLASPGAKSAAAACGALAVEMEAYPMAAWAQAQGLPFVHARVILDALGEALPAADALRGGFVRPASPARLAALLSWVSMLRAANARLAVLARALAAAWLARTV